MYTVHVHDKINVHVQLRLANRADLSRHKCLATMPLPQVVLYTSIPTVIHTLDTSFRKKL